MWNVIASTCRPSPVLSSSAAAAAAAKKITLRSRRRTCTATSASSNVMMPAYDANSTLESIPIVLYG